MELLLIPIAILAYLLWDEKRTNRKERQELLNRLQAPGIFTDFKPSGKAQHVPYDDDKAIQDLRESNGS